MYTLRCVFKFYSYPFDVQLCNIKFNLLENPATGCNPVWNLENNTINSKGELFDMYEVKELRYTILSSNNTNTEKSMLNINILVRRKFYSHLVTTFYPCIILYFLGFLTMTTFNLGNFRDRITVTLSLLIVVASLFSQAVSALPSSSGLKCVEIFFFFIIVQLAFIFLSHTVVAQIIRDKQIELKSQSELSYSQFTPTREDVDVNTFLVIHRKALIANRWGWSISIITSLMFAIAITASIIQETRNTESDFLSENNND